MTSGCIGAFEPYAGARRRAAPRHQAFSEQADSMTLADLKKGDQIRIDAVRADSPSVQRLMIMGLVEGAELTYLGASLGGDPLEFRLYGGAVSLRRDDGMHFNVSRLGHDG
jgi:Fe2+ transport system protein FeoA